MGGRCRPGGGQEDVENQLSRSSSRATWWRPAVVVFPFWAKLISATDATEFAFCLFQVGCSARSGT